MKCLFYLRISLAKQWKCLILWNFYPWIHVFLISHEMKEELLWNTEAQWSSWGKDLYGCFLRERSVVRSVSCFFPWHSGFIRRNGWQTCWLFRQGYLANIFSKWIKWAYWFKENNWQYFLPKIILSLSSANWNFGKLFISAMSLTASK